MPQLYKQSDGHGPVVAGDISYAGLGTRLHQIRDRLGVIYKTTCQVLNNG